MFLDSIWRCKQQPADDKIPIGKLSVSFFKDRLENKNEGNAANAHYKEYFRGNLVNGMHG